MNSLPMGFWEFVPPSHLEQAFRSTDYDYRPPVPKDWTLRGTGIHGPENGDVMKVGRESNRAQ